MAIAGLVPGRAYRVSERRVDATNANAYAAWVAMGSPQDPSPAERRRLEEAAALEPVDRSSATADEHGALTVSVELATHAICLLALA